MSKTTEDIFPDLLKMDTNEALDLIRELRNGRSNALINNIAKHEKVQRKKKEEGEKMLDKLSPEQLALLVEYLGGGGATE